MEPANEEINDEVFRAIALQDRFVRGLTWLRRLAGLTQRQVAEAAGWQQPYVDRLEDAASPLLKSMRRLERYAQACKFTTVVAFVDPATGKVLRTLPLDEQGLSAADQMLSAGSQPAGRAKPKWLEVGADDAPRAWHAQSNRSDVA